jgi:hypothetical protein
VREFVAFCGDLRSYLGFAGFMTKSRERAVLPTKSPTCSLQTTGTRIQEAGRAHWTIAVFGEADRRTVERSPSGCVDSSVPGRLGPEEQVSSAPAVTGERPRRRRAWNHDGSVPSPVPEPESHRLCLTCECTHGGTFCPRCGSARFLRFTDSRPVPRRNLRDERT